jgi:SAM-dependent methyltransferase
MFVAPDDQADLVEIGDRYSSEAEEATRILLDAVRPERPDWRICELGFGTGWLLGRIAGAHPGATLFGLDMSPGMTSRARGSFGEELGLVMGDIEHLPFGEACFDAVVTCWTLYFLRDIEAGLTKIKRSLRRGGRLVVAASAPDHMREYYGLSYEAERAVLGRGRSGPDIGARFDLESGASCMRRHFARVDLHEWHGWMVVADAAPILRIWDAWRPPALAGEEGDRVRAEFLRLADARLARDGEIRISHHGGALVGYAEP